MFVPIFCGQVRLGRGSIGQLVVACQEARRRLHRLPVVVVVVVLAVFTEA